MSGATLNWVLIPLCLLMSFWLSGMEAGVFALSRLRIRQLARAGRGSAKVLHQFLEKPENFLWTIIVGNTLVNFVALGWFFATVQSQIPLRSPWFVLWFVIVVLVFYTFFDLLPKMLFRTFPNRLCLALARPFRLVHMALRPLVAVVEWCARMLLRWTGGKRFSGHLFGNREELRMATQESEQVFTSEERAMINRVLDLENLTVRQIAKPVAEAVTISADATMDDALKLFRESGMTRLPVWQQRGATRRVAGLISAESLMFGPPPEPSRKVADLIGPALFLEDDLRRPWRWNDCSVAVNTSQWYWDGQEVGIVSLSDMLKTIFGEVRL